MLVALFMMEYSDYFYFDFDAREYRPREDKDTPPEALEMWASYINTKDYMKRHHMR